MEMRQLKYFIEIVNSKSFSKAATTLYTTQPALTKSIKLLEDELGFKLIDRSTSYFKLTDKGALFYQHARDVYNRFQDLYGIAKDSSSFACGTVNIGTMVVASTFFRDLIRHFAVNYPGVSVNIREKPSMEILNDIQASHCDIGFVLLPAGNLNGCQAHVITKEPMQIVMCGDDPLSEKDVILVDDLKNRGLILFSDDYQPHLDIMNLCLRDGFSPNVINTAPRIHLLIYMLKLRRGLTFLPSSYVNEYVKKDYPELFVKPFRHNITRVMSCQPGVQNAGFLEDTYSRLREIKGMLRDRPECYIGVDGGLDLEKAERCIKCGASRAVIGRYLFRHPEPDRVISRLQAAGNILYERGDAGAERTFKGDCQRAAGGL